MRLATMSPTMPVRQASSCRLNVRGASTFEVAEEAPSMPVRQASRRRMTAALADLSHHSRAAFRQGKPPSMPVRQVSKPRNMAADMRAANTVKVSALPPIRPERQDSIQKSTSATMPMAHVAELSQVPSQIAELQKPCYYFSWDNIACLRSPLVNEAFSNTKWEVEFVPDVPLRKNT